MGGSKRDDRDLCCELMMSLDAATLSAFQSLILGFVFAGFLASGFELVTERRASFSLLHSGGFLAVASVPMLVFSAPFIILRNTVRGRRFEDRPIGFVMLATIIAGFWSLCSGRVMLDVIGIISGA
jgi:hypothetical protein